MHVASVSPSRFTIWSNLENRVDRLTSYGALAVGLGVLVAFFVVL